MTRTAQRALGAIMTILATLSLHAPASAAGDGAAMRCNSGLDGNFPIPGFVYAEIADKPKIHYPSIALDDWSEGWVLLEYAVTPAGAVQNVSVVDALGHKDFVKASMRSVQNWRYHPATRNGWPVEQSLYQTSVLYRMEDSERGAEHGQFVRSFNRARTSIRNEEYDRAIATLDQAFKERLNLYEEAMGSFLLAVAFSKKGDWPHALYHARHAVIADNAYLEKELQGPALALLVELETRDGAYTEALCAFQQLRELDPASAVEGKPAAKTAAAIEAALKNPAPLATPAQLAVHPLFEAPAVWRHRLLRSKFSFAEVKGEVKSFRLACTLTAHEAPVDMETQWDVPSNAGRCILRVDGAPGATFTLVEE